MLSPSKAIAAGAVLFAIGGALLIAQPFHQQTSMPAAEGDVGDQEAALLSGVFEPTGYIEDDEEGDEVVVGADGHFRSFGSQELGRVEMSDDRLSGDVTLTGGLERFPWQGSGEKPGVEWATVLIENDAGSWVGTLTAVTSPLQEFGALEYIELVGTDGYEGWSAILYSEDAERIIVDGEPTSTSTWHGTVFPGNLPPDR